MLKIIIKEIFIMILLCLAILLVLGIIFYDYIPVNRVIPTTKEAYSTPENVKEEIGEEITEIEKTEISYEITDSDLSIYKKTSSYKPGKKDPFYLETEKVKDNTNKENSKTEEKGENKEENTNKEDTTSTDKNSTDTFFDDGSIK